ncbi:MAG TPA: helix-turn-helix domain-containing protein [Aeromicrobium sp.]|nr:helix-turn-helix domain-containing protein [Aeromicrobium sp.]
MNVDLVEASVDQATERILDAATAEFARRGVRRTTMNQIANAAGLGVATVYRRFPQKDQLIRAVILREADVVTAAVVAELERPTTVAEQSAGAFAAFAHAISGRPLLVRLMRRAASDDAVPGDLVDQLMTQARSRVADWIRELQADGRYLDADPDVVAELEARLAVSLVLVPEGFIPMHDDAATRAFATKYLVPLLGLEHR